jgi:hypothetical protein
MSDDLSKPDVAKPLLAKPMSVTIARETTYRVSKAQSLRMRAYDKKVEAAEARRAKHAEAQKAKLQEKGAQTNDVPRFET